MIKVGEYYYWYGENRYEDQSFESVRLYRSRRDWEFVKEPGYFQIKALHSSQCLDVAATSLDDGANILQWPCNGSDNQLWSFGDQGDGSFALASKHSGKCLDVAKWSTENGGNIQQWECTGRENQKFVEY